MLLAQNFYKHPGLADRILGGYPLDAATRDEVVAELIAEMHACGAPSNMVRHH
jgi:hypothetical protein